jgi:cystathionine beta-lyase/cystathionine gamma-synthase
MTDPFVRAELILVHDEEHAFQAVVPPIAQTSLFTFRSFEDMAATYRGEKSRFVYSRTTNPNLRLFEEKISALEGAEDAIGTASGMAAISSAILAFIGPNDKIVCVKHVYPDAYRFFETYVRKMGIETVYVDGLDHDEVAAALRGAKIFYMESPTSWMMETHDVRALAALAKANGVKSIIDNSWATPIFQQPIDLGVDLVIHSASKYIGGHSDVVAGVVAGSKEDIKTIRSTIAPYLGAKLAPFDAWLLLRGLRTLPIRMKAHQSAARTIGARLKNHPLVKKVHLPGLGNTLPDGLLGSSGLLSFEVDEGVNISSLCDGLQLFKLGVSWGGHESLVVPALVTRGQVGGPNSAIAFGVPENMVRIHVGLEGEEVLWNDLNRAISDAERR